MIATTGWDVATLRRSPARLVRALMWRAYAGRVWSRDLAAAANRELNRDMFVDAGRYVEALRDRTEAQKLQKTIEDELWPEDADG